MANATQTPETMTGKTNRLTAAIHAAEEAAVFAIVSHDYDALLAAWDARLLATNELLDFQAAQIRLLEAQAAYVAAHLDAAGINLARLLKVAA